MTRGVYRLEGEVALSMEGRLDIVRNADHRDFLKRRLEAKEQEEARMSKQISMVAGALTTTPSLLSVRDQQRQAEKQQPAKKPRAVREDEGVLQRRLLELFGQQEEYTLTVRLARAWLACRRWGCMVRLRSHWLFPPRFFCLLCPTFAGAGAADGAAAQVPVRRAVDDCGQGRRARGRAPGLRAESALSHVAGIHTLRHARDGICAICKPKQTPTAHVSLPKKCVGVFIIILLSEHAGR